MSRNNNNKNQETNELNELKNDNKKLLNYLLFAKKCIKLLEKYRNFLISLEICNKNIIIDKKFVNCLENEFKTLFDSENNFNNKWIETKLKDFEIIDKNNEKLIEEKNKVIKTREDL
jgi:phosphate starvation-inducible protein PhoH